MELNKQIVEGVAAMVATFQKNLNPTLNGGNAQLATMNYQLAQMNMHLYNTNALLTKMAHALCGQVKDQELVQPGIVHFTQATAEILTEAYSDEQALDSDMGEEEPGESQEAQTVHLT